MAKYVYVDRDIDSPATLLYYLGSHWNSVYGGQQQIRTIVYARGRVGHQTDIERQEAVDSVSRLTVPVFHTDHWYQLILRESERNSALAATPRYGAERSPGEPLRYGDGGLRYGRPLNRYFQFPAPSDLRDADFAFNRLISPSRSLTKHLDFYLTDGVIVFRENPFDSSLVSVRDVYENGQVVDREATLWLFRAKRDREYIYRRHGYVLGFQLPSSRNYRDLMNALRDGVVEGGSGKPLEEAVAAICDTPIARGDETVEHVARDARSLLVITDQHVYRYPLNASPIVSAGDQVRAGDQLVDTVQFIEFGDGTVPATLTALEIGEGLLPAGYLGGLTWPNREVAVEVDTSGIFTRVEWELGGFPGDIEKFWDDFHANGVFNPPTLAQLLDRRSNQVGEPSAAALPATINPLGFLAANVLRNHAFVVKIKHTCCGPRALPMETLRHLRRIIPPHTHMLIVMELAADSETITMDGPGDESSAGYEESPLLGPGLEPIEETITGDVQISHAPTLSYTEGQCI